MPGRQPLEVVRRKEGREEAKIDDDRRRVDGKHVRCKSLPPIRGHSLEEVANWIGVDLVKLNPERKLKEVVETSTCISS